MANPLLRPILWDIYEEHLDEAAWLWGQWERSLDSPLYTIGEVALGPEERLQAHLDGLVLGGRQVAEALLTPALADSDVGMIAAAAWALVQAEDADHQDQVIAALASAEPQARQAIARALSLCPRLDLGRLAPLWKTEAPEIQAILLDLFALQRPDWVRTRVEPALRSDQPALTAAALRAIRRSRLDSFSAQVVGCLRSHHPDVSREAIATGLVLGADTAWDACRAAINKNGEHRRFSLGVLASSTDRNDRAAVYTKLDDPETGQHALWALGFAGDIEAVDALLPLLAGQQTAKVAGEVFSFITGIAITGRLAKLRHGAGPDTVEVADDAPPPQVRPEDHLPEPDADAVGTLWTKLRARFHPGTRYLGGQRWAQETLCAGLATAPTWRRQPMLLQLEAANAAPPKLELRTWARDQHRQLRAREVPKTTTSLVVP